MKRTRRVEVIRYSRRVSPPDSGVGIEELLAITHSLEIALDRDEEPLALPEPIPVKQPTSTLLSRAHKLLKRLTP